MADENNPNAEEFPREEASPPAPAGFGLPFGITLFALLLYFGFQTVNLAFERGNLLQVKASQQGAIQEAQKIHTQFRTLIDKTGELADKGHAGAKMVMEGLQAQGLGISAAPSQMDRVPGK